MIRSWNRGAEKIFGFSAQEAIGRAADLIEPADRRGEMANLRRGLLEGTSIEQFETRRLRKDGHQINVLAFALTGSKPRGRSDRHCDNCPRHHVSKRIELELHEANKQLETAHATLVDAARQAGMAEIAVGVLHNVGNVLNSVNVSASMVDGAVRRSKASGLGKVVAMLKEHESDLGKFMENGGKGREVLAYLEKLSEAIASEQKAVLTEVEALSKNVEHIKEIVNAQQSYATAVALVESLNVRDLLEDAPCASI